MTQIDRLVRDLWRPIIECDHNIIVVIILMAWTGRHISTTWQQKDDAPDPAINANRLDQGGFKDLIASCPRRSF
jgi:hypothetical protein